MSRIRTEISRMKNKENVMLTSHDICTPLTAIKGYISLIREGNFGKVSPKVKQVLELVEDSANSLVATVRSSIHKNKK